MQRFDVAVIGGGLLGCFAVRNLCRWDGSVLLLEAREDVCTGISRANSAIIYPGYDHKPGTLKALMTVRGNEAFGRLCKELDVPFSRCGSLMLSYGLKADAVLRSKYERGLQSGVPGLTLISGREAEAMEPCLAAGVSSALYAPTAGTVNPWELCIAAWENARQNGMQAFLNTRVLSIRSTEDGYLLITAQGDFFARVILNCAGMQAAHVQELVYPCSVSIHPTSGDYLILDRRAAPLPSRIIQVEPEDGGKGLNAVPTVEGSLLLGPSERENGTDWAVSEAGLTFVRRFAEQVFPGFSPETVIRSFAALRPNPQRPDGSSIGSFVIEIDLTTVRTFSDIPTTFYYSSIPAVVVAVILLAFFRKTLGEFHNSYSNDVYGDSRLPAEKDGGKANKMYKGFNLTLVLGIAICVIFWILIFKGARI